MVEWAEVKEGVDQKLMKEVVVVKRMVVLVAVYEVVALEMMKVKMLN